MVWIESVLKSFLEHPILLSFFACMFGEEVWLLLIVFSANDLIPFWIVLLFGFLGITIHDAAVFYIGRHGWNFFGSKKKKTTNPILLFLEQLVGKTYLKAFIISKFIYASRVPLTLYISRTEKNFWNFLRINTIALLVWSVIMIPLGWFAGKGFAALLHIAQRMEKVLAAVIVVVFLMWLLHRIIRKKLLKSKR